MSFTAVVEVPATSANLGPGFDSFGLAVELRDMIEGRLIDGPSTVEVEGEGAGELPEDDTHLIARVAVETLADLGIRSGVALRCTNVIPQSRGLGSSAAAIVAGVLLGKALGGADVADLEDALRRATRYEGHPDNVAPAILGGFTVAWMDQGEGYARSLPVHPDLVAVAVIPPNPVATSAARAALPADVPYRAAVHNVSRSALLVHAMTHEPGLLLSATSDMLHQEYRRGVYPASMQIVDSLRAQGIPAFVSGAGPTVLALVRTADATLSIKAAEEIAAQVAPGAAVIQMAPTSGADVRLG